jgi:hypothetical protein
MGVPNSEVSYASATAGRGYHEIRKGHVVALEKERKEHTDFTHLPHSFYNLQKHYLNKSQVLYNILPNGTLALSNSGTLVVLPTLMLAVM